MSPIIPAFDHSTEIAAPLQAEQPSIRDAGDDSTPLAPVHKLVCIMTKIDERLSLLKEMLVQWHALLDPELSQDATEAHLPREKIDDMLTSIADLRERIATTASRERPGRRSRASRDSDPERSDRAL